MRSGVTGRLVGDQCRSRGKGLDTAAPKAPDPDEPSGLSAREQKILAAIEDDMLTADPALARGLTGANRPRPGPRGWATARHGVLLILSLIHI